MRRIAIAAAAAILVACGGGSGGGGAPPPADPNAPPVDPNAPPSNPPPTEPPATPPPAQPPPPTGGSTCTPATCASLGRNCGAVSDGCGGMLFCGSCPASRVCGTENVCVAVAPTCTPTTCEAARKTCGTISDGCGGTLACGTCSGGATCGGGGEANVCGTPPVKGGDTLWTHYVSGPDDERIWRVRADAEGRLYVVGTLARPGSQGVFVRRQSLDGAVAWEKFFEAPNTWVVPAGFAVSRVGEVYLSFWASCASPGACGVDFGGGRVSAGLVKLGGADGAFAWQKFPDGGASVVATSEQGDVATQRWGPDGSIVEVFTAAGESRWQAAMSGATALAFAPDGSLYVAWVRYGTPDDGPVLSKLDGAGKTLWSVKSNWIQSIATSARGTPVALEWSELAVYEPSNGAVRFRKTLPLWASDLAVQPGMHDVVRATVVGQDSGGCNQLAVRTYNLAGDFLWSKLVGANGSCGGSPLASGVTLLDGGDAVVGGAVFVPSDLGKGEYEPKGAADGFLLGVSK